jgi:hypothetical protein
MRKLASGIILSRPLISIGIVAFLALMPSGCASLPKPAADSARYQLDRLYFGRAIGDTALVSDSAWSLFMREVVTPRFPAGITSWRAEGQWRSSTGTVVREPSMVIEIIHPPSRDVEDALREVILEYERRFHQESVLRVTTDVRAQFRTSSLPRGDALGKRYPGGRALPGLESQRAVHQPTSVGASRG